VSASVPNPDNLSAFAALRTSTGALTVMVISKVLSGTTPVTVSLANFAGNGTAQAWQLTSSNQIARLADVAYSGSSLTATVPAQSITLFILAPGTQTNQPPNAVISATPASGKAPLTVNFSGAGSSDPDGSIASYAWTFGDGATGSGVTASHVYQAAGSYTAKLTVTDNQGATASATTTITATSNTIQAPSNLTARSPSRGRVSLSWRDNSSNEGGFYVERAPSGSTSFVRVGQVGANRTSYSESATRGMTYLYRVQAFNLTTGQVSAYSNQAQVRVR